MLIYKDEKLRSLEKQVESTKCKMPMQGSSGSEVAIPKIKLEKADTVHGKTSHQGRGYIFPATLAEKTDSGDKVAELTCTPSPKDSDNEPLDTTIVSEVDIGEISPAYSRASAPPVSHHNAPKDDGNTSQPSNASIQSTCEGQKRSASPSSDTPSTAKTSEGRKRSASPSSNTPSTAKKRKGISFNPKFDNLQDFDLYPGNILPAKLVRYIFSKLPEGKSGDSRFVKTIAVRLWGSNYLASHTVAGRVDPKLAKSNPDKAQENQREALDEERLTALKKALEFRLKVEGVNPADIAIDPRVKNTVINGYVRDKIKTLRSANFGLHNPDKPLCDEEKEEMYLLEDENYVD